MTDNSRSAQSYESFAEWAFRRTGTKLSDMVADNIEKLRKEYYAFKYYNTRPAPEKEWK